MPQDLAGRPRPRPAVTNSDSRAVENALSIRPTSPILPAPTEGSGRFRRGGRVVDRTALEMRHTGNRIGGSNPSLSATLLV